MFTFCLSFFTMAVKFSLIWCVSPTVVKFSVQNSWALIFYFVVTVQQQFVILLHESSNSAGGVNHVQFVSIFLVIAVRLEQLHKELTLGELYVDCLCLNAVILYIDL
jgi:hypothetical protein